MDPLTHAALGASCSQAALHHNDKRNAWIAGFLGALAPDLDVMIQSANPMLGFLYHRHFTHALPFIPVGGILIGLLLLLFKRFRQHSGLTILAATIGYATHALLDACTSYGTVLLWPFSMQRYSWDLVAIIDPWIMFPLFLGLTWTLVFDTRRGVLLGLLISGLVLLFNGWQHHRALVAAKAYARANHMVMHQLRALPELASRTRWRILSQVDKEWFIAHVTTPIFQQSKMQAVAWCPSFHQTDLPKNFGFLKDFNIFNWFTEGYIIGVSTQPLVIADARYLQGGRPLSALWGIQFTPGKLFVDKLKRIKLSNCRYP